MADLKLTDEEAKEYASCGPCEPGDGPKYPYGLRLCLESGSMKKLGLDGPIPVGSVVQLTALARVVSAGENEQHDGEVRRNMDLQITDMDLVSTPNPKSDADRAKRMYPDMA